MKIVICPNCKFQGGEEDFEVAIREEKMEFAYCVNVGFKCKCGHKFGFADEIPMKQTVR